MRLHFCPEIKTTSRPIGARPGGRCVATCGHLGQKNHNLGISAGEICLKTCVERAFDYLCLGPTACAVADPEILKGGGGGMESLTPS